jgi:hypothetical protein
MALDGGYAPTPEDDDFWNVGPAAPAASGGYTGAVPNGFTQADVNDFLARNPGDEHRVSEALVRGPEGGGQSSIQTSGAPQSIQPFGGFSFDGSKVGESGGFKFRFDKAMQAIQRSGAARGTLLSPQTLKALQEEASGLASQEYGAEFDRQGQTYDRNFGTHTWNEGNRYNSERTNRLDDWSFADSDRRFNRSNFESDRSFGYGQERDRADDTWRFIDYGYNASGYAR